MQIEIKPAPAGFYFAKKTPSALADYCAIMRNNRLLTRDN